MENLAFESSEVQEGKAKSVNFDAKCKDENSRQRKRKNSDAKCEKLDRKVSLSRNIGFFSCLGIIIGSVIGSGIFISPKGVLLGTGSVGLTLIIWAVCGFFTFTGSLAFAELGTLLPTSGGKYVYVLEGFAPNRKKEKLFWGPLVGFLYIWQSIIILGPIALAVQTLSCATYFLKLTTIGCAAGSDVTDDAIEVKLLALLFMAAVTAINCHSVKVSKTVFNFMTCLKVSALLFVIVSGIVEGFEGTDEALHTGFEGTDITPFGIASAFYSGLWAYGGWDNICDVAREVINPKRTIITAMMASCTIITVIYMLTNISYFVVLSKSEFLDSEAVAVDFGTKVLGIFGRVYMSFSVVCSVFGSITAGSFTNIRVVYAAAREGHVIDFLSYLHVRHMTPSAAQIFVFCISSLMIFNSSVLSLIFLSGFLSSIFLIAVMVSLLMMRRSKADHERAIKVPLVVPYLMIGLFTFLAVAPFLRNPKIEYLIVLLVMALGFVVYVVFVYYEYRIPKFGLVKKYVQIILEVAPPEDEEL